MEKKYINSQKQQTDFLFYLKASSLHSGIFYATFKFIELHEKSEAHEVKILFRSKNQKMYKESKYKKCK